MSRISFQPGDRVRIKGTRRQGVVVEDQWECCTPDEVPVLFDDAQGYEGTNWQKLEKTDLLN